MRTTVIPAQVTTVEDTIAGNLTLTQVILFVLPVFSSVALYVFLPVHMSFSIYKMYLSALILAVCLVLAIRIKGMLLLHWIILVMTYVLRPHLYLFNKNSLVARERIFMKQHKTKKQVPTTVNSPAIPMTKVSGMDLESLLRNTEVTFRFTRKGLVLVKSLQ